MLETPPNIQTLQRKLYCKAKQESDFRFYALYDKVYRVDILTHAYHLVKHNRGTPGIDGVSYADIEEQGVKRYIKELSQELKSKEYKPNAIKRVYIPKSNGQKRPLGIPTLKDRIVQMATKIVIEPIFEADFEPNSYGFRPKRDAHQAMQDIEKNLAYGYTTVIDADLSQYFDTIPHKQLLLLVAKRVVDKNILRLIKQWLKAPIIEELDKGKRRYTKNHTHGTPQGGVISPLLANIYLDVLDTYWRQKEMFERYGAKIVRYADDFVILCKNPFNQNQILSEVTSLLKSLELKRNPQKTSVVDTKQESFNFLGFTLTTKVNPKSGKRSPLIVPSDKAEANFKAKIKSLTRRDMLSKKTEDIVSRVNRVARGWRNYFYYGNCSKSMQKMDNYLQSRVRIFLRRKHRVQTIGYKRFPTEFLHHKLGLYKIPAQAPWTKLQK